VTILTAIGSMIAVPLFTAIALLGLVLGVLPIK
jgi:hypothetical protein